MVGPVPAGLRAQRGVSRADIQRTFVEAWPEEVAASALPHSLIELSEAEARALRRAHRRGADSAPSLGRLAGRVWAKSRALRETGGVFLRMGYGSWAGPQLAAFGTLEVTSAQEVLATLALRDRRLAEIVRRWGQGPAPKLVVRPYIAPGDVPERRVLVVRGQVERAWLRHQPTEPATPPENARAIALALGIAAPLTLDFMAYEGHWRLCDVGPVVDRDAVPPAPAA
ncbi:MAG: hypothetical protein AAGF78_04615 [Pseudomonadota bacterium]